MTSPYRNPWKGSPYGRAVPDTKAMKRRQMMTAVAVASSGAIAATMMTWAWAIMNH